MKALIILITILCNYSLPETITPETASLRMPEIQAVDSVNTNGLRIRPFNLEIIPPSSGVQFYRNGIIFLSHSKLEEKVPELSSFLRVGQNLCISGFRYDPGKLHAIRS